MADLRQYIKQIGTHPPLWYISFKNGTLSAGGEGFWFPGVQQTFYPKSEPEKEI